MNTNANRIREALVSVLNGEARAHLPCLWSLAYIKYPAREITPAIQEDGSYKISLRKKGYEYKCKYPRSGSLPTIDSSEMRIALNSLLENGLYVSDVEDCETMVVITLRIY